MFSDSGDIIQNISNDTDSEIEIVDLGSTVKKIGEVTTQIFHFIGGEKRTFSGIISSQIKEGEMLKLVLTDGRMLIINKKNLLMTEVFPQK